LIPVLAEHPSDITPSILLVVGASVVPPLFISYFSQQILLPIFIVSYRTPCPSLEILLVGEWYSSTPSDSTKGEVMQAMMISNNYPNHD